MVIVVDIDAEEKFVQLSADLVEKGFDDWLVAFAILKSRSLVVVVIHPGLLEDLLFLQLLPQSLVEYSHYL